MSFPREALASFFLAFFVLFHLVLTVLAYSHFEVEAWWIFLQGINLWLLALYVILQE